VRSVYDQSIAVIAVVASTVLLNMPSQAAAAPPAGEPDFGPNVKVFHPGMPTSEIQAVFDEIWERQRNDEMGTGRYALYFMPGSYGTADEPLLARVGYYTEVAGLGASPGDVRINGKVEVFNRCFDEAGEPTDVPGNCFALNNFWRGLSNLTIEVNGKGQEGCTASSNFWAVSQAVSLRRVEVQGGNLSLMDYCSGPSFASGGFIADSKAGVLINGSQQQWFTRNSEVGEWTNAVWNQVFTGVVNAPSDSAYLNPPYTTIDRTPVSREKPYLFVDAQGKYQVRVPAAQFDTRGVSWANGVSPGRTIPLRDFYVARPADSVQAINSQLARGKHLILTPGIYDASRTIDVKRADTVVLGMGLATLNANRGATALALADNPGIIIAGLTVDAGSVLSPVLLRVGNARGEKGTRRAVRENPTTLSDVYFRVGGPRIGKSDIALQINSDHVLIDHTWVWRGDHGVEPFNLDDGFLGDNQRWAINVGRYGAVVNGDDVTATGFFVEHFQRYNTVWNGERGRVYLYQCELPYDPPSQTDWRTPDGTLGWAGYKVADHVMEHRLWGGGVYVFNRNNPSIVTENGYEVPVRPGIQLTHVMTKNLSGPGTINAVVNGVGGKVDGIPDPGDPDNYEDPSYVVSYP
jgi:hypothetical protein